MGLCESSDNQKLSPQEREKLKLEKERNAELETNMKLDEAADKRINKLLLLGAGESGKSTLFKQAIKIYGNGFNENELKAYGPSIHSNIILSAKMLSKMSIELGFEVRPQNRGSKRFIDEIKGENDPNFHLTPEVASHIKQLWDDPGIQSTFDQRHKYQLIDSTAYFMTQLDRISHDYYIPDERDILSVRVRTTGIVSTEFMVDDVKFQMFDVGGQRNERKKWIHCFENVTAVLFVAAISEYDQTLFEDESINRILEALTLFEEICNSRWFVKTSMLLFLNKCDLFKEKVQKKPLSAVYSDYKGENTYEEQANYMKHLFESKNKTKDGSPLKKIYTHITCAMDTQNVRVVFNAVADIIMRANLESSGLMPHY